MFRMQGLYRAERDKTLMIGEWVDV